MQKGLATVAQLAEQNGLGGRGLGERGGFDAILDARSPGEFAEDHLPGATSCPVLSDAQRVEVGTLYKQVSPFAAKKVGAALVARNIADHIEKRFIDQPKSWRPLVYCWRGGKRSGAFVHILREIGWDAHRLEGGYKAWRRQVIDTLALLPQRFDFRVVSGPTGSAKSRILEALARQGAQILHLEELAAHKGSVLGRLPDVPQPGQKMFESRLLATLETCDASQPIYVEAESRRIGQLQVPDAIIAAIRAAPCLRIEAGRAARADFLLRDYDYFVARPSWLIDQIGHLHGLQGNETLAHWTALIEAGDFRALVEELLEKHYDPLYQRSQEKNYRDFGAATVFAADTLSPAGIEDIARHILVREAPGHSPAAPRCVE